MVHFRHQMQLAKLLTSLMEFFWVSIWYKLIFQTMHKDHWGFRLRYMVNVAEPLSHYLLSQPAHYILGHIFNARECRHHQASVALLDRGKVWTGTWSHRSAPENDIGLSNADNLSQVVEDSFAVLLHLELIRATCLVKTIAWVLDSKHVHLDSITE